MLTLLLFSSILMIVFAYAGYPISLYIGYKVRSYILSKIYTSSIDINSNTPRHSYYDPVVFIILAVANEKDKIHDKIINLTESMYNHGYNKCYLVITCDNSTDGTDDEAYKIIDENNLHDYNITIVNSAIKLGKEGAQQLAIDTLKTAYNINWDDLMIFTDVSTMMEAPAITQIVNYFKEDKNLGSLDCNSVVEGQTSEGLYMKYENSIRALESKLGCVVSNGGSLFAILTEPEIYNRISPKFQSDFGCALATNRINYNSRIASDITATYPDLKDKNKEYSRKQRTIVRGLNSVYTNMDMLNPFSYPLFSYALFSHKLLKWLVPFFMIVTYITNLALFNTGSIMLNILFVIQTAFYGAGYTYIFQDKYIKEPNKVLSIIGFFILSNIAILNAWYTYIVKGERFVTWKTSKR